MKHQNKIYTSLMVLMAAIIILFGFLVYFILGAVLDGSAKILSEKREVMVMQLQDKAVADFKTKYKDYAPDLQKVSQLFVDSADPINFIQFLEQTSFTTNVVSDISIVPSVKNENAQNQRPIAFQIKTSGDFSNIIKFSEKLEAGPYLVKVTNVTIQKLDQGGLNKNIAPNALEANFSVEALSK